MLRWICIVIFQALSKHRLYIILNQRSLARVCFYILSSCAWLGMMQNCISFLYCTYCVVNKSSVLYFGAHYQIRCMIKPSSLVVLGGVQKRISLLDIRDMSALEMSLFPRIALYKSTFILLTDLLYIFCVVKSYYLWLLLFQFMPQCNTSPYYFLQRWNIFDFSLKFLF